MIDKAQSVLARLKNKAAESGKSFQLCLQLFCQEEFLRRLAKSEYSGNFVLKGGLFIYSITDFDSRVTADVDLLTRKIPNTPECIEKILGEIIEAETDNDYVIFEIKDIKTISIDKKYSGVSASLVAQIKNTRTPFGIDFGFGDVIVPKCNKRKIPTQLGDFEPPEINTYSIETTIAEKLDAILYLMEFSSRMKDYYDIYYLANKFDFNGNILTEALRKTFENREHTFSIEQFNQVKYFDDDESMLKKWNAFCRKIKTTEKYKNILKTIDIFLTEPYSAAISNDSFSKKWKSAENSWVED